MRPLVVFARRPGRRRLAQRAGCGGDDVDVIEDVPRDGREQLEQMEEFVREHAPG